MTVAVKGTPEERRAAREKRRLINRAHHVIDRATGQNARVQVTVACNAALAVRKRITEDAGKRMAAEIARVVERFDTADNKREVQ